jgi:urease accessory protein
MESDTRRMRGERPYVFTNLRTGQGVQTVIDFIVRMGGLTPAPVAVI